MGAHSTVAQMVHMLADVLTALREQEPLSDQWLNALRVRVLSILHHRGWGPEADLEHVVAAGYPQRHLLDMLTIVALKVLNNYVNHIAHTLLDP